MDDLLERFIEKQINDGFIEESELQQMIEDKKKDSPIVALQEDLASLMYDLMFKNRQIANLEKENSELAYLIMMGDVSE